MSDLPSNPQPGDDGLDPDDIELDEIEDNEPEEPDDQGDEPEPEPEDDGEEPEPRRAPAGGRRTQQQRLQERNRQLASELQELRSRVDNFARPQPAAPDPAAQQRAEQEKWERRAMMSPTEAMQDMQREAYQQVGQAMQIQQARIEDRIDKQNYDAEARVSKQHRDYRDRVEALLATERAAGNYGANRDILLTHLVGLDARKRGAAAAPAQRRAARGRVAAQTARPTNARGDAARSGGGRNQDSADEAMLRGLTAGDV